MKKTIRLFITMMSVLALLTFVTAGDFQIEYSGSKIFTVATSGDVNASGVIYENNVLLSDTYLALSGGALTGILSSDSNITTTDYFVGNGKFLTGINIEDNSTQIVYQNITNIPTCGEGEHLDFDGSDLTCTADSDTFVANYTDFQNKIEWSHLINGTFLGDIWGTLGNGTMATTAYVDVQNTSMVNYIGVVNTSMKNYVDWVNSTNVQAEVDFTNVAYYNETNTWAEDQIFDKDLNVTGNIRLMTDTSIITRDAVETTNISIDSSGNVIISLG